MTSSERRKYIARFLDRRSRAEDKEDGGAASFWIGFLGNAVPIADGHCRRDRLWH